MLWNPHVPTPAKNLADGAAMIAKGKSVGAGTQRERDYLDALGVMYADSDKVDHRTRIVAYAKAMEQLAQRYPSDDEAQIHYALALNTSASAADKTYANQIKGAAILEPISKRQPQHPGVAHYLIHLYDYPSIAEKGLDAARRYAKIAPAAAHAQHMPSHIFTRVGYWDESIASNIAAARVAKEAKDFHDQLHAMDYQVYANLQLGQDAKAKALHRRDDRRSPALRRHSCPDPMRWLFRRHAMRSNAATGRPRPNFRSVRARWLMCRRSPISRARSGPRARAIPKPPRLISPSSANCATSCVQAKDAYWSEQVDIQAQVASALVLFAEGKHDEALKAMSAAADAEDKTEKHPVTPGVPKPARELYGVMLLERGMAKEALAAFEATLKKEPNRLGAYVGAAKPPKRPAMSPRRTNITRRSSPSPAMRTRAGSRSAKHARS